MEASAQTIHFELLSPEEKLISCPVKLAVLPGVEGVIGVGKDHASMIVGLQAGLVRLINENGDETDRVFIEGGFADVTQDQCIVLAEDAVPADSLDTDVARSEMEKTLAAIQSETNKEKQKKLYKAYGASYNKLMASKS